ncbi:MAG: hypothetical protein PWP09_828 [Thermotogota bacterium]|nr:hypothetical protein [Thermotogota bacterium]
MDELLFSIGSVIMFAAFLIGIRCVTGRKRVLLERITQRTILVTPLMLAWLLLSLNLSGMGAFILNLSLIFYVAVMHFYAYLSFKQTLGDTLIYLSAIEPLLFVGLFPDMNPFVSRFLVILSFTFAILGLWRIYRLPLKNHEFLDETLKLCASNCSKGAYSSRPVVLALNVNPRKNFVSSSKGVLLVVRNGKLVLRISRKKHEELGSPNLMELAENLANEWDRWLGGGKAEEVAFR